MYVFMYVCRVNYLNYLRKGIFALLTKSEIPLPLPNTFDLIPGSRAISLSKGIFALSTKPKTPKACLNTSDLNSGSREINRGTSGQCHAYRITFSKSTGC